MAEGFWRVETPCRTACSAIKSTALAAKGYQAVLGRVERGLP